MLCAYGNRWPFCIPFHEALADAVALRLESVVHRIEVVVVVDPLGGFGRGWRVGDYGRGLGFARVGVGMLGRGGRGEVALRGDAVGEGDELDEEEVEGGGGEE